jgi:stage V sporulation protein SpoVS
MLNRQPALLLLLVASLAALAAGCNKQPQSAASAAKDDAEFAINLRKANVDSIWQAMIASNDKKIANSRYFLEMASLSLKDSSALQEIKAENEKLASLRYNQQNLRDLIDMYDSAENKVLQDMGELYNTHPEIQIVNTSKALEEIKAADDSVLIFRFMYDKAVEAYNQSLSENKKAAKDQNYTPLPLFRLNP